MSAATQAIPGCVLQLYETITYLEKGDRSKQRLDVDSQISCTGWPIPRKPANPGSIHANKVLVGSLGAAFSNNRIFRQTEFSLIESLVQGPPELSATWAGRNNSS